MVTDKKNTLDQILRTPVIPVYFHSDPATCIAVLEACYFGGIRAFEFTNRGTEALQNFKALKEVTREKYPDLILGIGTIKDTKSADAFIAIGADFIVSPIIDAAIAQRAHQHGLLWIPGCMTPTEIAQAEKAGATLVKLFPGNILGTPFLDAIKALFPGLMFMPTGGVAPTQESMNDWFSAGVKAVGLGSKLFENEGNNGGNYDWLSKRCSQLLQCIENQNNL